MIAVPPVSPRHLSECDQECLRGKIAHATLTVGDGALMGADVLPEQYKPPQGFHVLLSMEDAAEAERIYHALSKNGTAQMPLQQTFWSIRFGVLVDQYGVSWEVNCERSGS
jgi:PhnB protein